ncbi:MAG: serine/threonine-protein kinase PknG, partial [Actinomycetota bacterium]|nr:serine/threonine-protein kinase PknG [Actinomycetota bacterium]
IGSARRSSTRPTRRLHVSGSRTQHLGAGITTVPSAPVPDPRSVVLAHPEVPEEKRFCSSCGAPVGRSHPGKPGRTEGFCPRCRMAYSFAPKLQPGEIVGGQYEVVGCIAHGGLGWIYLARDRNVSDRYVVLKGLLNTGDKDAYEAAITERQFLAQVQYPLILEIYNFASHEGAGYIVMEYVGGRSLKQILKDRMVANGGKYDPFPVDQAIAYIVDILPAFGYLHSQGLLYCDFKPDNVIQAGDTLKLIDLGGVRKVDDEQSAIYGTTGFQAPEVADVGPSVASDIFTIGRTLAVLAMEFRGYQSTFVSMLPPVADAPLFQNHDSLYRALLKATAPNPDDRFQSSDELRDQLIGVLRESVALQSGDSAAAHSSPSALFGSPTAAGADLDWTDLPALRVDRADPSAAWLAGVSLGAGEQLLRVLEQAPAQTVEVQLAKARAAVDAGFFPQADALIDNILTENPWEWRAVWIAGLAALARVDFAAAQTAFNTVLGQVPGELAPKLALAIACEKGGADDVAEYLYAVCAATDANYVAPAAFGLARTREKRGDIAASLNALDLVAPTSGAYVAARRRRAELLTGPGHGLADFAAAAASIENLAIDPRERQVALVAILTAALAEVRRNGEQPAMLVANVKATQPDLRAAAERAYRELAVLTSDRSLRIRLVDEANAVRPRTLV